MHRMEAFQAHRPRAEVYEVAEEQVAVKFHKCLNRKRRAKDMIAGVAMVFALALFLRRSASAQIEAPMVNGSPANESRALGDDFSLGGMSGSPASALACWGGMSGSPASALACWGDVSGFPVSAAVRWEDVSSDEGGLPFLGAAAVPSSEPAGPQGQTWNWHLQSTGIAQGYPSFTAQYSGVNSLPTSGQVKETVSADFYGGYRLWNGAEAHVDLLMWQGFGLDNTFGIEDFTNGEAYKIGVRYPHFTLGRIFLRQKFRFGNSEQEDVPDDALTLAGTQPVTGLTITIGRFSSKDIFDNNAYANDPRTQFMNWAFVGNVTWDYPADTLGFTTGVAFELNERKWSLRYGFFQLPSEQNGYTAEDRYLVWPGASIAGDGSVLEAWGMVAEVEHRNSFKGHPGAVRLLGFVNRGRFGSYRAALSVPGVNISLTQAYRHTYGFGISGDQEITRNIGVFYRLGWNNGRNEAWMYTDANHSGSGGIRVKGGRWHHPGDTVGLAGVISGITHVNQQYLEAGGTGILDGDGALAYKQEKVLETYYNHRFSQHIHGALDYQFVADPAFNRARGPVSVFSARLHWEF